MKLLVTRQHEPHERRVPMTPAVVKKLVAEGFVVLVEANAGTLAHQDNEAYEQVGAQLIATAQTMDMWAGKV